MILPADMWHVLECRGRHYVVGLTPGGSLRRSAAVVAWDRRIWVARMKWSRVKVRSVSPATYNSKAMTTRPHRLRRAGRRVLCGGRHRS